MVNEAYILNTSFDIVAVVDAFESFIWTERYFTCGDFELYMPVDQELMQYLVRGNYVTIKDSEYAMVIEKLELTFDPEKGGCVTVTGRSLESLLERRVIWKPLNWNSSLQNGIKRLVEENVISPSNADRVIPNFIFLESTDTRVTSLKLETYLYGENLYEAISSICTDNNIGFRVLLRDKKFVFELYKGMDRTYDQTDRPYVVFSPDFDNILTSTYYESDERVKNCSLVSNEVPEVTKEETKTGRLPYIDDDGQVQYITYQYSYVTVTPAWKRTVEVKANNYQSGINRREIFVDTNVSDDDTESQKLASMRTKGSEQLADMNISVAFDASVDPSRQFIYGVDFFIGDVVQIRNEYGYESKARITELIRSVDTNGNQVNPTFTVIENLE